MRRVSCKALETSSPSAGRYHRIGSIITTTTTYIEEPINALPPTSWIDLTLLNWITHEYSYPITCAWEVSETDVSRVWHKDWYGACEVETLESERSSCFQEILLLARGSQTIHVKLSNGSSVSHVPDVLGCDLAPMLVEDLCRACPRRATEIGPGCSKSCLT